MFANVNRIEHVSDTALMTAACRAIETHDPNGLLHDPFAAKLAGKRGMAIAQAVPILDLMRLVVSRRDRFIDELLMDALRNKGI